MEVCLHNVKGGYRTSGVGELIFILHRDPFVTTQRYAIMTTLR